MINTTDDGNAVEVAPAATGDPEAMRLDALADMHDRLLASCRDQIHFSVMWRIASVSVPMLLAISIWVVVFL